MIALSLTSRARAQTGTFGAEGWGQTYRPAGVLNMEGRARAYPWLRAETQVWTGQSAYDTSTSSDVVVLAAHLREPTGHLELRGGRFVLTTGAVRPIHIDGGYLRTQTDWGSALEAFSGVPVVPRFGARAFDWLVGGRLSQRVGAWGAVGVSYIEQRDHGSEASEQVGGDAVAYPLRDVSLSARASYDLVSHGLAELTASTSMGSVDRRAELFTSVRNASLILPATSLFSVLSDTNSVQAGTSGRWRVAPRLRLEGTGAYRGVGDHHGARLKLGGTLWLDDEGTSAIEGVLTQDGVRGQRWTGARTLLYRDLMQGVRLMAELELVLPDEGAYKGQVWPWGRLSGRYAWHESWQFSAGVEGSSSPQFTRLVQALLRVAYVVGST